MQESNQSELTIKDGDLFLLGDHRIICGDARNPEIIKKLFGSEKARAIISDVPYAVGYVEGKAHFKETIKANLSNTTVIQGDQLQTDEEYIKFTKDWLCPVVPYLQTKNAFYIFNSDLMICPLKQGVKEAGGYNSQMIIWVKNTSVLGRKDYNPQHELILYGWFGSHKFERGKAKSVIFAPKPSKSKLHPTMKPVSLIRKLILNSTRAKEIIYDGFLGSGTAIVAAEQTSRRCFGAEIDPHYISVCIQRFEQIFGKKAVKQEN